MNKTTVVLVHGAFADGSSWNKVIPILQARELDVVAVQNPLTSLADDVAAARRAMETAQGPVVLVGHSWGGAVITQAGADPKVKALVYVAAFALDAGQSVNDLLQQGPAPRACARIPADFSRCLPRLSRTTSHRTCRPPRRNSWLRHRDRGPNAAPVTY